MQRAKAAKVALPKIADILKKASAKAVKELRKNPIFAVPATDQLLQKAEETAQHKDQPARKNSSERTKKPEDPKDPRERITIPESRKDHIFREKEGHFKSDTVENRKIIESIANNPKYRLNTKPDQHGNTWSAKLRPDGKQIWVQVRNGKVINAGLNDVPRSFNPQTGLSRQTPPNNQGCTNKKTANAFFTSSVTGSVTDNEALREFCDAILLSKGGRLIFAAYKTAEYAFPIIRDHVLPIVKEAIKEELQRMRARSKFYQFSPLDIAALQEAQQHLRMVEPKAQNGSAQDKIHYSICDSILSTLLNDHSITGRQTTSTSRFDALQDGSIASRVKSTRRGDAATLPTVLGDIETEGPGEAGIFLDEEDGEDIVDGSARDLHATGKEPVQAQAKKSSDTAGIAARTRSANRTAPAPAAAATAQTEERPHTMPAWLERLISREGMQELFQQEQAKTAKQQNVARNELQQDLAKLQAAAKKREELFGVAPSHADLTPEQRAQAHSLKQTMNLHFTKLEHQITSGTFNFDSIQEAAHKEQVEQAARQGVLSYLGEHVTVTPKVGLDGEVRDLEATFHTPSGGFIGISFDPKTLKKIDLAKTIISIGVMVSTGGLGGWVGAIGIKTSAKDIVTGCNKVIRTVCRPFEHRKKFERLSREIKTHVQKTYDVDQNLSSRLHAIIDATEKYQQQNGLQRSKHHLFKEVVPAAASCVEALEAGDVTTLREQLASLNQLNLQREAGNNAKLAPIAEGLQFFIDNGNTILRIVDEVEKVTPLTTQAAQSFFRSLRADKDFGGIQLKDPDDVFCSHFYQGMQEKEHITTIEQLFTQQLEKSDTIQDQVQRAFAPDADDSRAAIDEAMQQGNTLASSVQEELRLYEQYLPATEKGHLQKVKQQVTQTQEQLTATYQQQKEAKEQLKKLLQETKTLHKKAQKAASSEEKLNAAQALAQVHEQLLEHEAALKALGQNIRSYVSTLDTLQQKIYQERQKLAAEKKSRNEKRTQEIREKISKIAEGPSSKPKRMVDGEPDSVYFHPPVIPVIVEEPHYYATRLRRLGTRQPFRQDEMRPVPSFQSAAETETLRESETEQDMEPVFYGQQQPSVIVRNTTPKTIQPTLKKTTPEGEMPPAPCPQIQQPFTQPVVSNVPDGEMPPAPCPTANHTMKATPTAPRDGEAKNAKQVPENELPAELQPTHSLGVVYKDTLPAPRTTLSKYQLSQLKRGVPVHKLVSLQPFDPEEDTFDAGYYVTQALKQKIAAAHQHAAWEKNPIQELQRIARKAPEDRTYEEDEFCEEHEDLFRRVQQQQRNHLIALRNRERQLQRQSYLARVRYALRIQDDNFLCNHLEATRTVLEQDGRLIPFVRKALNTHFICRSQFESDFLERYPALVEAVENQMEAEHYHYQEHVSELARAAYSVMLKPEETRNCSESLLLYELLCTDPLLHSELEEAAKKQHERMQQEAEVKRKEDAKQAMREKIKMLQQHLSSKTPTPQLQKQVHDLLVEILSKKSSERILEEKKFIKDHAEQAKQIEQEIATRRNEVQRIQEALDSQKPSLEDLQQAINKRKTLLALKSPKLPEEETFCTKNDDLAQRVKDKKIELKRRAAYLKAGHSPQEADFLLNVLTQETGEEFMAALETLENPQLTQEKTYNNTGSLQPYLPHFAAHAQNITGNPYQLYMHQRLVNLANSSATCYKEHVERPFKANKNWHVQHASQLLDIVMSQTAPLIQAKNYAQADALLSFISSLTTFTERAGTFYNTCNSSFGGFIEQIFSLNSDEEYIAWFGKTLNTCIADNRMKDSWVKEKQSLTDAQNHLRYVIHPMANLLQTSYASPEDFISNATSLKLTKNEHDNAQKAITLLVQNKVITKQHAQAFQTILDRELVFAKHNKNDAYHYLFTPLTYAFSEGLKEVQQEAQKKAKELSKATKQPAPTAKKAKTTKKSTKKASPSAQPEAGERCKKTYLPCINQFTYEASPDNLVEGNGMCGFFAAYNGQAMLDHAHGRNRRQSLTRMQNVEQFNDWVLQRIETINNRNNWLNADEINTLLTTAAPDTFYQDNTSILDLAQDIQNSFIKHHGKTIFLPVEDKILQSIRSFRATQTPHLVILNVGEHWIAIIIQPSGQCLVADSINGGTANDEAVQLVSNLFTTQEIPSEQEAVSLRRELRDVRRKQPSQAQNPIDLTTEEEASKTQEQSSKAGKRNRYDIKSYNLACNKHKELMNANLQGANLAGRHLEDVDFTGANLKGANLSGAILDGSIFEEAQLQDANLSNASLKATKKGYPIFTNAHATGINAQNATFENVKFRGTQLNKAQFKNASIRKCKFIDANLTDASFQGTRITATSFEGKNLCLQKTDFTKARIGKGTSIPQNNDVGPQPKSSTLKK